MLSVFCSECPFLGQWVQAYSLSFLFSDSKYLVLRWCPWPIWRWILCRVMNVDLCSFYMWLSSVTGTICQRCCLLSSVYPWLLGQKPVAIGVWVLNSISLAMILLSCQCNVIDADELNSGPVFTEQVLLLTDLYQPSSFCCVLPALSNETPCVCTTPPPSHGSMLLPVTWKPAADVISPFCPTAQQDWHLHIKCCHEWYCMGVDPEPCVYFASMSWCGFQN